LFELLTDGEIGKMRSKNCPNVHLPT
jgi:hypothetical protein